MDDLIKPGDILSHKELTDLLFYNKSANQPTIKLGTHDISVEHIEEALRKEDENACFELDPDGNGRIYAKPRRAESVGELPSILPAPEMLPPLELERESPLRAGQMDYAIPDRMELGRAVTCIVRLGDKDVKNIQIGTDSSHISSIEVSDEMSVRLIDPDENFRITPITNERQALEPGLFTEWKMSVKPLTEGTFPLLLRISCHFDGRTKDVEVLEKSITVVADMSHPGKQKKIAFIAAGSKSGLLLGKESNEIWEELQLSPFRDDFSYVKYFEVSSIQFNRALSFEKPTVVHFSGHGSLSGIFLANEEGEPILASNEAMADFFEVLKSEQSPPLECVILNACLSSELATILVKTVPVVIGTNTKIGDDKAIQFSEFFYRALGKRRTYHEAFTAGRTIVSPDDDPLTEDDDLLIYLPHHP